MTVNAILEIYRRRFTPRNQRWRWRLKVQGNLVANSGEGYSNKKECRAMGEKVVRGQYNVIVQEKK